MTELRLQSKSGAFSSALVTVWVSLVASRSGTLPGSTHEPTHVHMHTHTRMHTRTHAHENTDSQAHSQPQDSIGRA